MSVNLFIDDKPVNAITGIDTYGENDNSKYTYSNTKFSKCKFYFHAKDSKVIIRKSIHQINNLVCHHGKSTLLDIGNNFSCWGCDIRLDESNCVVTIGNDCMFSFEICIYPTDGHTIISLHDKKILNESGSVIIGNHCWVGRRAMFLKNSSISDNTVVGMCSLVTHKFSTGNCILSGIPAKVAKNEIQWFRENITQYRRLTNNI